MSLRTENGDRIALKNIDYPSSVVRERRALLQRVLWSRQLERHGRIKEFLEYVCERSLEEAGIEIHEQEIGHRVFGRTEDYDTSADNIVRVTASQARKKLELFFAGEGRAEPIILEIPKGQYTPFFREREIAPPTLIHTPEKLALKSLARWRRIAIALLVVSIVLAAVSFMLNRKLRAEHFAALSPIDEHPALHALWSQLLPTTGRTDIVVADSSLSLFEELLNRQLTLAEYLKPSLWAIDGELPSDPKLRAFAGLAAQRGFTSMASVTAVSRITRLAGRDQTRVSILRARDFNMTQMKFDNVVLLGSSRANPWQDLLEDHLNFRFGYDQATRYSYFENRNPRPGEAQYYRMGPDVSYCRIAFLPNFAGTGNLLSIAGTEIEGTEGGSEFITTESSLAKLMSVLNVEDRKPMPHFEVILRSSRVGGQTEAVTIIAYRILK